MKHIDNYICGTADGWSLYRLLGGMLDEQRDVQPEAEGLSARDVLQQIGGQDSSKRSAGCRVVIGVPARWCLCSTVCTEGLPQANNEQTNQALAYRLEALLPITAEDCSIGFIGDGENRLGIATRADRLQDLVLSLEDAGYSVEAITPCAMLAAQSWLDIAQPVGVSEPTSLVWEDCKRVGEQPCGIIMHLDPGRPLRWRVVELDPHAIAQQIGIDGISPGTPRHWCVEENAQSVLKPFFQAIEEVGSSITQLSDPINAECLAAKLVLERPDGAWVNLRTGPLAQRYPWRRLRLPVSASIAAAILFLSLITILLFVRAHQYDEIAAGYDRQSAEQFAQIMPGQAVPTSPQRRLKNRLKQLRGERGMATDDSALDEPTPPLLILHDLLAQLPSKQRFALTDLRLEGGHMRLTGYARSHSEADKIANALREGTVFVVDPPSTDNLPDGGVRFTLKARHLHAAELAKNKDTAINRPAQPSLLGRSSEGGRP